MASLDLQQLEEARKILCAHFHKSYQKNAFPEKWMNLGEVPSKDEIMPAAEAPGVSRASHPTPNAWDDYQRDPVVELDLPVNVVDGPWESEKDYVGSHYQLLREDSIAMLRKSVGEIQAKPDMMDDDDTCIYTQVTFVGFKLSRIGVAFRIAFSTDRASKQIRWQQSKRLQQGTLVALSPYHDRFKTVCKLAVIAGRPYEGGLDQNPPTVELFWADTNEAVFDPVEKYLMVESRQGYYEASRYMLVALQKMMTERSVLTKHVAFMNPDIAPPTYLEKQPFRNLSALSKDDSQEDLGEPMSTAPASAMNDALCNVDVLKNFPRNFPSDMDESQLRACEEMLTRSVAVVQGPPGCGKTFTSVSVLKIMIQNLGPEDPPILLAAQTNHALDQLLNHIMRFEERVVRLGSRTNKENHAILKRTLYQLRTANLQVPHGRSGNKQFGAMFRNAVEGIKKTLGSLLRGEILTTEGLFNHGLITEAQRDSLLEGEWEEEEGTGLIADWVGQEQLMQIPTAPLVNLGLPIEEEDIAWEQAQRVAMALDGDENDDGETPFYDKDLLDDLSGDYLPILRKLTGKHTIPVIEARMRKLLKKSKSLHDIPKHKRGDVYRFWEKEMNAIQLREFRGHLQDYQKMVSDYQINRGLNNVRLIHHLGIKVVGCTTTGLAKYRGLISALQPRILLVEEAAETLEGTIMSGFVESLQHLILVGDHQQLTGQCTLKKLEGPPYFLNMSMFERLVKNKFPYVMLNQQRRMIPDIRKLLCIEPEPFYRGLHDHATVLDPQSRPPVSGMGDKPTYFFTHDWPDARNSDSSYYNPMEAEMVVGVYHYLVYNGVPPEKITILTFYNGQRRHLLRELHKNTSRYGRKHYFRVFTIDSYQGEENDIILLSLVRSNSNLSIGFLNNKNRLVVALSRARRALYIFGNAVTFTMSEDKKIKHGGDSIWTPLIMFMKSQGRFDLDGGFPIKCIKHGNTLRITEPYSWAHNAGGCEVDCKELLSCGHVCTLLCHPFNHEDVLCKKQCPRVLSCGHKCSGLCGARPCHCAVCAIAEGTDGPQNFGLADSFSALELKDILKYEFDDGSLSGTPEITPLQKDVSHSRRDRGGPSKSQTPITAPLSAPNQWRNWDAKKADEDMVQRRRLEEELAPAVDRSTLVFNEIYVPVDITNGSRKRTAAEPKRAIISRLTEVGSAGGKVQQRVAPQAKDKEATCLEQAPEVLIAVDQNGDREPGSLGMGDEAMRLALAGQISDLDLAQDSTGVLPFNDEEAPVLESAPLSPGCDLIVFD